LLSLAVRRGIIQEDAHAPVALAHHRRSVQEQGETQAADIDPVNFTLFDVIGQKSSASVKRGPRR
jgi:hypothetical protein